MMRDCQRKKCKELRGELANWKKSHAELKQKLAEVTKAWMDERNKNEMRPQVIMAEAIEDWLAVN